MESKCKDSSVLREGKEQMLQKTGIFKEREPGKNPGEGNAGALVVLGEK